MDRTKYSDVWGHSAGDLRTRLIQIGNNHFAEHGDFERYKAEKVLEARGIDEVLGVRPHEIGIEIGSGTGVHTRFFAERCAFLHSFDVSTGFSDLFREQLAGVPNVSYVIRNFFPVLDSVPDASVDFCYATSVFCHLHVYDVYLYLEEITRKLKAGGRVYINFQNANFGPGSFFRIFLEHYRANGVFAPIAPAEMQFHSNEFFETTGTSLGLTVTHRRIVDSYSEYIWKKQ